VQRVDLQLLLGLRSPLLGRDNAIADRRQGAVPEALPGILVNGAEDVLGVFLGLVFVEQRHDLPHHDVHGVVAHLLGDGNEFHAILGELPDVKLKLEVIAEEPAEGMDHDNIEGRRLGRACLDHALKLGATVVGGRRPGLHIGLDELVAARLAISLALPLLVGNGNIVLGLPARSRRAGKGRRALRLRIDGRS
jgi:hypothetical protein